MNTRSSGLTSCFSAALASCFSPTAGHPESPSLDTWILDCPRPSTTLENSEVEHPCRQTSDSSLEIVVGLSSFALDPDKAVVRQLFPSPHLFLRLLHLAHLLCAFFRVVCMAARALIGLALRMGTYTYFIN